jgi:hypothetical protein
MQRHFVRFYSPGTFVAETTEKPIDSWDVEAAKEMAAEVKERHGARPYGFCFTTRSRGPDDLDSKETAVSGMHYLQGKIETLAEIKARNNPDDHILIFNMEANGYDRVISTTKGWRWTQPFTNEDVLLEETP